MDSLEDFTGLTRTVADYLERADLDDYLPRFVGLAEKRLNRRLNLAGNETATSLPLVDGMTPLPEDYEAWRSVVDPCGASLEYLSPHAFWARYRGSWRSAQGSRDFTIVGSMPVDDLDVPLDSWSFGIDNPFLLVGPAASGQVRLLYRQGIPPLGANRPVNWLLAKHPDLYLYATLLEAEPFLRNETRIPLWRGLLEAALDDVSTLDRDARWGRARIRPAGPRP